MNYDERFFEFDKTVYRKQYGSIYIKAILTLLLTSIFLLVFSNICTSIGILLPTLISQIIGGIIFIIYVPIIPFIYYTYSSKRECAKKQSVLIKNNKLYCRVVLEDGVSWTSLQYNFHSKEYHVHSLDTITLTHRYIVITGDILCMDNKNHHSVDISVTSCKLPRTFINENYILELKK